MKYLNTLLSERDGLKTTATNLLDQAADEQRSLTDAETATLADIETRLKALDERIAPLADMEERESAHAGRMADLDMARRRSTSGTPAAKVELRDGTVADQMRSLWPSPGHYVLDYAKALRGDQQAQARIARGTAEYRAQQGIADSTPILPEPIVGPVIDTLDASRPLVAALGSRPMPSTAGQKWTRPKIAQRTQVGKSTGEFQPLPSRKMTLTSVEFTQEVIGGTIEVSWENRQWTDPGILDLVVMDMYKQYALAGNAIAVAGLQAGVTQTEVFVPASATYQGFVDFVFAASLKVKKGCGQFPNAVIMAPDVWAKVGPLSSPEGRLLLGLDPTSYAGSPLGVRAVVDEGLTAGALFVGNTGFAEFYETPGQAARVESASTFALEIGVIGAVSFGLTEAKAFVKAAAA